MNTTNFNDINIFPSNFIMRYLNVHTLSPLLYALFVKGITMLPPCPKSNMMRTLRKYHNINLSILSGAMFVGMVTGNIVSGKVGSFYNLLSKPYDDNAFTEWSTKAFLYSKYLEWGDTLFLHLSGKPISTLQYTHHMSTAWLMYMNMVDYPTSNLIVFVGLNCFVHVPMYWYFAYPKGILYPYRKDITTFQIIQHILCLVTIVHSFTHQQYGRKNNVPVYHNEYGLISGFAMYLMYLFYFSLFYVSRYLSKDKGGGSIPITRRRFRSGD